VHYPGRGVTSQHDAGAARAWFLCGTCSPSAGPLGPAAWYKQASSHGLLAKSLWTTMSNAFWRTLDLSPSRSKTSCRAKLGPEQNGSPGGDTVQLGCEMLAPRRGPSLPCLREAQRLLLRLAAGRNAGKEGSSMRRKSLREISLCAEQGVASGGWVREEGLRKGFVPKLFLCWHIDFTERGGKTERGGTSGSWLACRWELVAPSPCSTPVCDASLPPSRGSVLSLGS